MTEDKAYKVFKEQFYDFIRDKWSRKKMRQSRIEHQLRRECGLAGCMERLRASGELISSSMERLRLSECDV